MDPFYPPASFNDHSYYSLHFMDVDLWEPTVRYVTALHGFECQRILPGLAGTFPTFIAELNQLPGQARSAVVVKFFGQLFDGAASFIVEKVIGCFIAQKNLSIHSPSILAEGCLTDEWAYLIFEYIPGVSIGQIRHEIGKKAWEHVAEEMGIFMHELHSLTPPVEQAGPSIAPNMGWESYSVFLETQRAACQQNHMTWRDLPAHLLQQIPEYIVPIDQLLDLSTPPHLIHADLTADHLLGRQIEVRSSEESVAQRTATTGTTDLKTSANGQGWNSMAIIDWGDCRVGNILYELVALHMDLFQADKHLLRICLQAYRLPIFYQTGFARKAFSTVLLHQFPMPASFYAPYKEVQSLDELAECLFGI